MCIRTLLLPGSLRSLVVLWLGYFAILLWTALPHGMHTALSLSKGSPDCTVPETAQLMFSCKSAEPLRPMSTNADIIRVYKKNDPAAIAQMASASYWANMPSWPPGMLVIEMFLYRISPILPVVLMLVLLTNALWAAVFTQISVILRDSGCSLFMALLLPLFLLFSKTFDWFIAIGVLNTEPLGIAFFLLGIGKLAMAATTPKKRSYHAITGGTLIAASAYFRPQTDYIMATALLLLLPCLVLCTCHYYRALTFSVVKRTLTMLPALSIITVALLAYFACTLPYRAFNHGQMIDNINHATWHFLWEKRDYFPPELANVVTGGGAIGCEVDPETCKIIRAAGSENVPGAYFELTFHSFVTHPLRWLAVKSIYLRKFWFDGTPESVLRTVFLLALCLRYAIVRTDRNVLMAFFLLCTLAGVMGPLIFSVIDPRYFLQLQYLIFYSILITFGRKQYLH